MSSAISKCQFSIVKKPMFNFDRFSFLTNDFIILRLVLRLLSIVIFFFFCDYLFKRNNKLFSTDIYYFGIGIDC